MQGPARHHARSIADNRIGERCHPEVEAPAARDRARHETVLQSMRSLIRNAMMQQELFYGNPENGYRYAWRADQLEWPDDMTA